MLKSREAKNAFKNIYSVDKHLTLKVAKQKNLIKVKDIFILKLQYRFQHCSLQQGFNIFGVDVTSVHIFSVHVFDLHVIHKVKTKNLLWTN